jgi:Na+/H+ antiporter NhaD/arsenite permease-like protein
MSLILVGFILHGTLHLEPATVALFGAALLLLITKLDPTESFEKVEWNVIFFFLGLFVLVGGIEHVGVISILADKLLEFTAGNQLSTTLLVLWGGGIFSSIVDNIPFVATMAPLINDLASSTSTEFVHPVWWALSLGACLGGNGTLVGASANLVVMGMAEKQAKIHIQFLEYMKVAMPLMLISLAIATVYMWLRFFV